MNPIDAERFEEYRPLMFSIAYRMLGSITEAEDIVQDAYLRYQAASLDEIVSHKAFLSTIVTRLCLNQLQSARVQRETYIGPWLPEPLLTGVDEQFAPARRLELHESLSMAFLVLLEQLTPAERAVFLLREVFDYDYGEIAVMIGKSDAACRKIFSRAKQHIAEHRPRFSPEPKAHRQMLEQFIRATGSGELAGLMQILAEDVELWADGGGKVRGAATRVLRGRETVAQFVHAIVRRVDPRQRVEIADLNGVPALIVRDEAEARITISLDVDQGHIGAIHVIGNPDKLRDLNRMLQKSRQGTDNGQYTLGDIIS